MPHQPDRQHGHERARQQVGGDHRKADRQRQRHEQRADRLVEDERRNEHRQDAEHGQQPRRGRGGVRRRAARAMDSVWRICAWVFSMVTVASSTSMPMASASPPSDMMLIVLPVSHRPTNEAGQRQGNAHQHHDHAAHVAQEEQDHQAGQRRADRPFRRHALDGRPHRRRFVELVTDVDVLGHHRLEQRHRLVNLVHHGQGRSRVLLDHGDVDRLAAVDQRAAVVDIRRVLNGGHVADVDVLARLNGDVAHLLGIGEHGVGRHQRHLALRVEIARRHDDVAGLQGRDHVFGRKVVRPQAVGIHGDDDRAGIAAKRRKSDGARNLAISKGRMRNSPDRPIRPAAASCSPTPGSRSARWPRQIVSRKAAARWAASARGHDSTG